MTIFRPKEFTWTRCGPPTQTRERLRIWYREAPGIWLAQDEIAVLDKVLPDLFGYQLLQVGVSYAEDCLAKSKIPNQTIMDIDNPPGLALLRDSIVHRKMRYLRGIPEQLPIASDSVDVMLLSHTLEFSADPHQVLREVDRILVPEGHVVILGFNPWGWWMWWKLLLGWWGKPPWCGHFLRMNRIKDWLRLLGFEITAVHGYFYRPPLAHKGIMNKLMFIERFGRRLWPFFSGAYCIVAKKRVTTLTAIRPRWRPRRSRLSTTELAGNSSSMGNYRRNQQ